MAPNYCPHMQAKCLISSSCCKEVFSCQLCHNANSDHDIDLANIKFRCIFCNLDQEPRKECQRCGLSFGNVFCATCKVVHSNSLRIIHCNYCNQCKFYDVINTHCHRCDICILPSTIASHKCRVVTLEDKCPICYEGMKNNFSPVFATACGHKYHLRCYISSVKITSEYVCQYCRSKLRYEEIMLDKFNMMFMCAYIYYFGLNNFPVWRGYHRHQPVKRIKVTLLFELFRRLERHIAQIINFDELPYTHRSTISHITFRNVVNESYFEQISRRIQAGDLIRLEETTEIESFLPLDFHKLAGRNDLDGFGFCWCSRCTNLEPANIHNFTGLFDYMNPYRLRGLIQNAIVFQNDPSLELTP